MSTDERPSITAEEFERQYAERSGVTVEQLRVLGRFVAPCDCDYEECHGWQMARLDNGR